MSGERLVLGIDLGTTNSCVGVYRNGKVEIFRNCEGKSVTPSIVTLDKNPPIVGDQAKDQSAWNVENTVYGIKRLIGRTFDDPVIQNDIKMWPFSVTDVDGRPTVQVMNKTYHPEQISSMILSKMKEIAKENLGFEVNDAVITVPAYFDNNQRQATRNAGQLANLNVLRLINEPTAAAIAYGIDKRDKHSILVYDLGGGTFDVSILVLEKGVFEVKATGGDTHLGGEDFDNRVVEHFAKEIKENHGQDIYSNKSALRRLKHACEKAKIMLSSDSRRTVMLEEMPNLMKDLDFELIITRSKFEELNFDLFQKTISTVEQALKDANMVRGDIKDVVLVGGSTRIPKVQNMLKDFFKRDDLNLDINPDEAVAFGAAVQGAILSGYRHVKLDGFELYDVVPLSLGTDVRGDLMSVIVPRNTKIPTRRRSSYTTTRDNQTSMLIQVYEGERPFLKDNSFLGETVLTEITAAPRGDAQVDVIFEIDEDCILHVKGRNRDTYKEVNKQIFNNAKRLNDEQMRLLLQEAEINRLADRLEQERIVTLNELGYYMEDIKNSCNTKNLKIPDSQKSLVTSFLEKTKEWIDEGENLQKSDFEKKMKELEDIWNPIITMCMEKQKGARGRSSGRPIIALGD